MRDSEPVKESRSRTSVPTRPRFSRIFSVSVVLENWAVVRLASCELSVVSRLE